MKTGNVTGAVYDRSIHKKLKISQNNHVTGAVKGEDCAFFSCPDAAKKIITARSLTAYSCEKCGAYAVYSAANQAAAAGASKILGILLEILLPPDALEQQLRKIVEDAQQAAIELGTVLADVKASVTAAVNCSTVTATAVGMITCTADGRDNAVGRVNDAAGGNACAAGRVQRAQKPAGSQIVMTKWAGLEGSTILANACESRLAERYPSYLIDEAKNFMRYLFVTQEAAAAVKSGVGAMCAVSEGGVFHALWTLAERAGVGLEIDLKKIPIRQETVEICNWLDVNPYELAGNGSLLCIAKDGEALVDELQKEGVFAAVIGRVTDNNDRVILNGEERRFLEPAKEDEIYKILK
ncbi:MAG: hydrogenase maturation factor [Lachnospiraceae bacterium]|nr:hydrogenase maturation factor [Lachnospiraceae bacterium]